MHASWIPRKSLSILCGMVVVAGSLALAPPSVAATTNCRATLIRSGLAPGVEPVVANSIGSPCIEEDVPVAAVNPVYVGIPDATGGLAPAAFVEFSALYARTDDHDPLPPSRTERGSRVAETGVAALTIRLRGVDAVPIDGPGYIDVDVLTSSANCNVSESAVGKVGFVWAGVETEVPGGPVPATIDLPGGLGKLYLNRTTVTGTTRTQQALVLDLAATPGVDDLVVAEATATC